MAFVWLSLGSNMGDRKKNIFSALSQLRKYSRIVAVSSLYETEPVGFKEQNNFLNLCAKMKTAMPPEEVMEFAFAIEKRLGRQRMPGMKNGPRTIDIDILFYDDLVLDSPSLKIPHPRMHERRFVLVPLAEISPEKRHPLMGKTVSELLSACSDTSKVSALNSL